jgi:hypothetical protein
MKKILVLMILSSNLLQGAENLEISTDPKLLALSKEFETLLIHEVKPDSTQEQEDIDLLSRLLPELPSLLDTITEKIVRKTTFPLEWTPANIYEFITKAAQAGLVELVGDELRLYTLYDKNIMAKCLVQLKPNPKIITCYPVPIKTE